MHNILFIDGDSQAIRAHGSQRSWHKLEREGSFADFLDVMSRYEVESSPVIMQNRGQEIATGNHQVFIHNGHHTWPVLNTKHPQHIVSPGDVFGAFGSLHSHFSFGTAIGDESKGPRYFTAALDMGNFNLFGDVNEEHTSHLAIVIGFVQGQHTVWFIETTTRIVCENTLRRGFDKNSLMVPLSGANKLDWAEYTASVWESALRQRFQTIQRLEDAYNFNTSEEEFVGFCNDFFSREQPAVMQLVAAGENLGVQMSTTQADAYHKARKRFEQERKQADNSVTALAKLYNGHAKTMSSGAAALNAATHFDSHGHPKLARRNGDPQSRMIGDLVDRSPSVGAAWLQHACGE